MDPVISEILRVKLGESVRPDVMQRWQRHLRDVVAPVMDEVVGLRETVIELYARLPPEPNQQELDAIEAAAHALPHGAARHALVEALHVKQASDAQSGEQ